MGVYLNKPVTDKESYDGGNFPQCTTRYGLTAMQGWRIYMEDSHFTDPEFYVDSLKMTIGLFGVFDGHGGPAVSKWVTNNFDRIVKEEIRKTKENFEKQIISSKSPDLPIHVSIICESLKRSFLRVDEELVTEKSRGELKIIHDLAEEKRKTYDVLEVDGECSMLEQVVANMADNYAKLHSELTDFSDIVKPTNQIKPETKKEAIVIPPAKSSQSAESVAENVGKMINAEIEEKKSPPPLEPQRANKVRVIEDESMEAKPLPSGQGTKEMCSLDKEADQILTSFSNEEEYTLNAEPRGQPYNPETCGSTAIVTAVLGGSYPCVVVANAGDSRSIICRAGKAIPLSVDHKPNLKGENRRIVNAGGLVFNGRVDGNLNLSRSLGDLFYKTNASLTPELQKISAAPDIRIMPITPEDEFLVLACDGIWDCFLNQNLVVSIKAHLADVEDIDSYKLSQICEKICDQCLASSPISSEGGIGCDNMTLMIVMLGKHLVEGGVTKSSTNGAEIQFYGPAPNEEDYEEVEDHDDNLKSPNETDGLCF